MNGHVFQCYGEVTKKNHFARTMEELRNYVGLHFKHHPADIKKMMKLMQDVDIVPPTDPPDGSSETTKQIWQQEVKMMYCEQVKTYKQNKCALYSVIWGQCSEAMQAKIKSDKLYDDMREVDGSLMLIKMIKGIAYKFASQKNIYLVLDNAKCAFYAYKQGPDETNANYLSKFKNTI